jgi:hypothetical protein
LAESATKRSFPFALTATPAGRLKDEVNRLLKLRFLSSC